MKNFVINLLMNLLSKLGVNVVKVEEANKAIESLQKEVETLHNMFLTSQHVKAQLEEEIKELNFNDFMLNATISDLSSENTKLKKSLEGINNRLLNLVNNNIPDFEILSFVQKEVRPQYDVTDTVIYILNGQLKTTEIVTRFGLEHDDFNDVSNLDELLALDQSKTIYYD